MIRFVTPQSKAPRKEAVPRLRDAGAIVVTASPLVILGTALSILPTGHNAADPLVMNLSIQCLTKRIARLRGFHPHLPRQLRKTMETM